MACDQCSRHVCCNPSYFNPNVDQNSQTCSGNVNSSRLYVVFYPVTHGRMNLFEYLQRNMQNILHCFIMLHCEVFFCVNVLIWKLLNGLSYLWSFDPVSVLKGLNPPVFMHASSSRSKTNMTPNRLFFLFLFFLNIVNLLSTRVLN